MPDNYFPNSSNLGIGGTSGTGAEGGSSGPSGPWTSVPVTANLVDMGEGGPENRVKSVSDATGPAHDEKNEAKEGDTVSIAVSVDSTNDQLERELATTVLSEDSVYETARSVSAKVSEQDSATTRVNNADIADELSNLTQDDISPFTDDLDVAKPEVSKHTKLESVGIYKTIDLLSEGPIAGLCDAHGDLIPLIDGEDSLNEDGLKGIYLNDVPVKNTRAGTLNYQRILAEIKYGTLTQGLLQDNEQKALSFLRSSQTFNAGITLPGLNYGQYGNFVDPNNNSTTGSSGSFAPVLYRTPPPSASDKKLLKYEAAVWTDTYAGDDGGDPLLQKKLVENQLVTVGKDANYVSIFTKEGIATKANMIQRIRKVFADQPVVYHHTITNDNVSDVEISLFVDQLFLRSMKPSHAKDPFNNSIFFLVKIGYEDSDRLIADGGDTFYAFVPISGLVTSRYERSYTFPLPVVAADRDRRISICLASEEPPPDAVAVGGIQRKGGVSTVTEIVDAPLVYPHSAIMATLIDARAFGRVPKRTFDSKLLKIKIPNNYDSENREYTGNWTGQWAPLKQWSNNPAWVFYDMMTSRRYGLAKYGFGDDIVDKWNLYSIGKYCDELVETGYRPSQMPLNFWVDPSGGVIFINDKGSKKDGSALGEETLNQMFPQGESVALYQLKDENSAALNRGYRRRIGSSFYDKINNIFSFNIHKIINSEYIFTTFEGLRQLYSDFSEGKQRVEKRKMTPTEWIIEYLNDKARVGTESDVVREYTMGYSLGSSVRTGKVVMEKSLFKPVLEPRFSTNIYLDREQDAFNCLNDLAAIFRGMVYWNNGFVFISNDQSRDAVMVFTNSNVKEGVFTYTGSSKSTRFSSVLVRYNDAQDSYKPKVEYIEDAASIRKYGYLEKKIVALGTTSRSQAYRLGKWFLFTNQLETDLVQFKSGIEATYLRPGDVVKIQDSLKNTKRYGGRVKAIDPANYQLTLDQGIYENVVGQKITLIVPQASTPVTQLNADAKEKLQKKDFSGIEQNEIDETRATQIQQFTVSAVSGSDANSGGAQNDVITVEDAEDFSRVAVGTIWSMQNTAADYKIKEVEYRVLSVTEETAGEYGVTAMMYAGSKFGAIDESRNLVATQQSASILNPESVPTDLTDWERGKDAPMIVHPPSTAKEGNRSEQTGNPTSGDLEESSGEEMREVSINLIQQIQEIMDTVAAENVYSDGTQKPMSRRVGTEIETYQQAYVDWIKVVPSVNGKKLSEVKIGVGPNGTLGGDNPIVTQVRVYVPPEATELSYTVEYRWLTRESVGREVSSSGVTQIEIGD